MLVLLAAVDAYPTERPALAQATTMAGASVEIPMELLFSRPLIRGTVNGEGPIAMLIDPQLHTTVIAPALADRLQLKTSRNAGGATTSSVEMGLGQSTIANVPVEVRDTVQLVPELGPANQPAVVLGLSLWGDKLVTLDYGRFKVRVEAGALPEPNGDDVYALARGSNELPVPLAIGNHSIDALPRRMTGFNLRPSDPSQA